MTIQEKFDLTNRVAIVTGGVGLLGAEFCKTLAEAGAAVAVVDLNADAAKKVADDLTRDGFRALGIATDITSPDSVNAMVASVLAAFGRLDACLRDEERPREIDIQCRVPLVKRIVFERARGDSLRGRVGIKFWVEGRGIYQHIEPPKGREDRGDHRRNGIRLGDVGGDSQRAVTVAGQVVRNFFRGVRVQIHDCDSRACFRERAAKLRAEQAHPAGDNGDAIRQIKFFLNGHFHILNFRRHCERALVE